MAYGEPTAHLTVQQAADLLAVMEFTFHSPAPPLGDFVEAISWFAGYAPRHTREKLIADGAVELIVDLGETAKKLYAGDTDPQFVDFRRAWISGMHLKPIVIEAQPMASLMVVRFRPGGAYPLLGHDLSALTGDVFALDAVVGAAAASLRDRVLEPVGGPAKVAAAEAWLSERLTGACIHPLVADLTARLDHPLGLRIADVVSETGYSGRHVLDLFRRWVGITPKQYARLRRFQQVLTALSLAGTDDPFLESAPLARPDWAAMAADLCFSDQSHLAHEFAAFAGMTPGAYVAGWRGLANYLPITVAGDRIEGETSCTASTTLSETP